MKLQFILWLLAGLIATGARSLAQPVPAAAPNVALSGALFTQHLAGLAKQVPDGFTIITEAPFIVIGDEPDEVVKRRSQTVKWAVDKLKQDFFQRDPDEIIDIWLFRDNNSYTNHARILFEDVPSSPYGYYSSSHHALIINIGTGTGTLVHEIVHPFIRANFPACPPWLNEGLASLYEAPIEKNGHIQGRINWRFKGLEKAIKEGKTISFQKLTSMDEQTFYGGDQYSQHYSQARYLCYYLQEQGLLVKFYRQFVSAAKQDPTGCATLKNVLGESDMEAFRKKWEKFVLGFRGS